MSWDGMVAGDHGQTGKLTMIDVDTDAAADVSGYTTSKLFVFRDPQGSLSADKTAAFDSDGSDGVLKYTIASGDIPAGEGGSWAVRPTVTAAAARLTGQWHVFQVEE